jgi:hypothetical protein
LGGDVAGNISCFGHFVITPNELLSAGNNTTGSLNNLDTMAEPVINKLRIIPRSGISDLVVLAILPVVQVPNLAYLRSIEIIQGKMPCMLIVCKPRKAIYLEIGMFSC